MIKMKMADIGLEVHNGDICIVEYNKRGNIKTSKVVSNKFIDIVIDQFKDGSGTMTDSEGKLHLYKCIRADDEQLEGYKVYKEKRKSRSEKRANDAMGYITTFLGTMFK